MQENYKELSWFKKLFFPTDLAYTLSDNTLIDSESAWRTVKNAYLNQAWFFKQWPFSFMRVFSETMFAKSCTNAKQNGLLTGEAAQNNFKAIASNQNPKVVYSVLRRLLKRDLLNQGNFNQLLKFTPILFANRQTANLTAIFNICQQYEQNIEAGRRDFINHINHEVLPRDATVRVFNTAQSTHTDSVHKTASESAERLKASYGTKTLGAKFRDCYWRYHPTISPITYNTKYIEVAIRCFERLTAFDYFFIDNKSNVSTKQLLALAWCAIHDDTKR